MNNRRRHGWVIAFAAIGAMGCANNEDSESDDDAMTSATRTSSTGAQGATGGGHATDGSGGAPVEELPAGCFSGPASCQPLTNAPCAAGEACDVGLDENGMPALMCFPPPNAQALGEACDPANGPFCAPTLACASGTCAQLCCGDLDCEGVSCTPLDPSLGTLGTCSEPPTCEPSGGPCVMPADCCSNDCHAGHCH